MSKKIRLRIVTPKKIMLDKEVDLVIVRGQEGDLGIMKGHAPLTTGLAIGILKIHNDEQIMFAALYGGFVEVNPQMVTILTDNAEWGKDIDKNRAEKAKERAEKYLSDSNYDSVRAEIALKKSLIRIETKGFSGTK